MTSKSWLLLCGAVLLLSACSESPQAAPGVSSIRTSQGEVAGKLEGTTRLFLGLPYAAPPVGELRFAAPQPPASWQGVRSAVAFGARCHQPTEGPTSAQASGLPSVQLPMSEDCLTLNVYTPAEAPPEGSAVMVFIHGGSGVAGSGADYDARALSETGGVVVVTLNYRLGPLGLLAHPELDAALGHPSGNLSLRDTQQALRWVQQNIAAFGGDPDQVTLFGQSAGASTACLHIFTKGSEKLVKRFIMESGGCVNSAVNPTAKAGVVAQSELLLADLCPGAADKLACLRGLDPQALSAWVPKQSVPFGQTLGMYVDGELIPKAPLDALIARQFHRGELLAGSNLQDAELLALENFGGPWVSDIAGYRAVIASMFPRDAGPILAFYKNPASDAEANALLMRTITDSWFRCPARTLIRASGNLGGRSYLYSFEVAPALHAQELDYVFGQDLFSRALPAAPRPPLANVTKAMQSYWTQFAKTGNPNGLGQPQWPQYKQGAEHLVFADPVTARQGLFDDACDLWDKVATGLAGFGTVPVVCGGSTCKSSFAPACCTAPGTGEPGHALELTGRAADRCGTDLSQFSPELDGVCLQLNQPGRLDPACPDVPNAVAGQPAQKGCCTDEGFCGAYEGSLPLGCFYGGARGKPCGASSDAGLGADAGEPEDAGDGAIADTGVGDAGSADAASHDP
jgi:para-nitrobenzyl esterase